MFLIWLWWVKVKQHLMRLTLPKLPLALQWTLLNHLALEQQEVWNLNGERSWLSPSSSVEVVGFCLNSSFQTNSWNGEHLSTHLSLIITNHFCLLHTWQHLAAVQTDLGKEDLLDVTNTGTKSLFSVTRRWSYLDLLVNPAKIRSIFFFLPVTT